MSRRIYISLIVFIFLSIKNIRAENADQLFATANDAYQNGQYEQAVKLYEQILTGGYRSKAVFYNLANAYYRLNQNGRAVLNYERALRFAPRDTDIRHNLTLTRNRLVDTIVPLSDRNWVQQLRGGLSPDIWSVAGLILFWCSIAGLAVWLVSTMRQWKKRGFMASLILIPLSIIVLVLGKCAASSLDNDTTAVVMVREVPLYAAPDTQLPPIMTIHEGLTVNVQVSANGLCQVSLPNGDVGWLTCEAIEKI
jgi:hypothetical protein